MTWLHPYSDSHTREKRLLLDEVVQVRKEKDLMERDNVRKDTQILQAREELDKSVTALRSAETKIQMLRNQVGYTLDLACRISGEIWVVISTRKTAPGG